MLAKMAHSSWTVDQLATGARDVFIRTGVAFILDIYLCFKSVCAWHCKRRLTLAFLTQRYLMQKARLEEAR